MADKKLPPSPYVRNDCRTTEMVKDRRFRFEHPNAECVGECYEGCCDKYECPDCGTRFTVEMPQ